MNAGAIVVAAGKGTRLGGKVDKPYVRLGGKPLLCHSLGVLQKCRQVRDIILVVHASRVGNCRKNLLRKFHFSKIKSIVAGGKTRQASVAAGLKALSGDLPIVIVHDAARPFITPVMVHRVMRLASKGIGATLGMPVTQTIKKVDDEGVVVDTPPRRALCEIQTPQAFPRALLLRAHDAACREGVETTDDASLVERQGGKVQVVLGASTNLKVTTPLDLWMAHMVWKRFSR